MASRWWRHALVLAGVAGLAALAWPMSSPPPRVLARPVPSSAPSAAPVPRAPASPAPATSAFEPHAAACAADRPLLTPTGVPPRLSCRKARALIAEMHARFAGTPSAPRAKDFARLLSGWLDPHGLWSAAPDAPFGRALREHTEPLLSELRAPAGSAAACTSATLLGDELRLWSNELAGLFDEAARRARPSERRRAARSALAPVFQDDPVTEPARSLARRLGENTARFAAAFPGYSEVLQKGRERYFPPFSAEAWGEVVLAAAVRAYIPLIDPHGDWAPFEEEWSLYADDPGLDGEPRLWREITRTAVGVRIVDEPAAPLTVGSLVLSVDGVLTAGMPLEQAEQLARLEPRVGATRRVSVLTSERSQVEEVVVDLGKAEDPAEALTELDAEEVRFGDGRVLVVRIPDVPDGIGQSLSRVLAQSTHPDTQGVLLDLRGNGGGSTDGAAEVLGLFLPGAPLFPLAARGKLVEVMRAAEPPINERFAGPVAALVDGYTASAAEMIAGGLSAYGRGPVLGSRTFGKGCIQEYTEDRENAGVLRVTTLLYALPNGAPVQRVGLTPDISLPGVRVREHESDLPESLPAYRGPDVRDLALVGTRAWPSHRGRLGPCADRGVCRALFRLGGQSGPARVAAARRLNARTGAGSGARL